MLFKNINAQPDDNQVCLIRFSTVQVYNKTNATSAFSADMGYSESFC
jgi:hypothetical protein